MNHFLESEPEVHELPKICTDLDFEMFHAIKRALGANFVRAAVDRDDGLILYGGPFGASFRFATALCGYRGVGPDTAIAILEAAGFGNKRDLASQVYTRQYCTFTKDERT